MAQEVIDTGAVANDGTGDTLRVAFTKTNANFDELYALGGGETAAQILAKLLTVDGLGSGLDADLLDGLSSAAFATAVHAHAIADVTGLQAALDAKLDSSSYTAADVLAKLLTVDGAGSGIDADLLDGLSSAAFAAASHTHAQSDVTGLAAALAAKLDASAYTAADVLSKLLTVDGAASGLDADLLDGLSSAAFALASHSHAIADVTGLQAALDAKLASADYTAADVLAKLLTVDGHGSGLNADLLDGLSSADFAATAHTHAQADVTGLVAALAAKLDSSSYTAADVLAKLLTVDGAGSGIDADLLDGLSSAAFAAAAHSHAIADVTGLQAALDDKLDAADYTAADVLAKLLTVDGSGSGIDADLLDGVSSSGYFQTASVLLAVDGNAGAPAYSFASDTDIGLYRAAANTLGASVGGVEVFNLTADVTTLNAASEAGRLIFGSLVGTGLTGINGLTFAATATCQLRMFGRAAAAAMNAYRANGTSASPTAIVNNNNLAQYFAFGATDTTPTMASAAGFQITATENWSGSVRGCRMSLFSTATGTTTLSTTCLLLGTQTQHMDGTAALPSVTFQNDVDCGMYRIGANQVGISAAGTLVLDIATGLFAITATTVRFNTTTATTVGAAGGASALPATPLGYLAANVGGTAVKIPYYNN